MRVCACACIDDLDLWHLRTMIERSAVLVFPMSIYSHRISGGGLNKLRLECDARQLKCVEEFHGATIDPFDTFAGTATAAETGRRKQHACVAVAVITKSIKTRPVFSEYLNTTLSHTHSVFTN